MRLWWVRHGPTHARTMIGWTDAPADLSDTARLARLRAALPLGAPVLTSDLLRAVATADALDLGGPRLTADPRLREMHFGAWEGRTADDVSAEAPDLLRAFYDRPGAVRAPGGEGWDDMAARVAAAVQDAGRLRLADLVIVAHMGPILSQWAVARGLAPVQAFAQRIDNLSLTVIAHGPGARAVRMVNHCP
jgi:broad specificity phosphatase PhoE